MSGAFEEGSVDRVLIGKACDNRTERFPELMYEVCMAVIRKYFMDQSEEEKFPEYQELQTLQSNFNKLTNDDLDRESFNEILESDV